MAETRTARSVEEPDFQYKTKLIILIIVAALVALLWGQILSPFFPVLAWSLALTSIIYPLHRWIRKKVANENLAAGISVCLIALFTLGPATFVMRELVRSGADNVTAITSAMQQEPWKDTIRSSPQLRKLASWANRNFNIQKNAQDLLANLAQQIPTIFTTSIGSLINLILMLFTSFYFLRDKARALNSLRFSLPISTAESNEIFARVEQTIYATIYGTLAVSALQGALGGLIFWIVGLPAPILWSFVMAILALVPYLGTSLVWGPAAIFLALQGNWSAAIILGCWGFIVIATIDNLLYPLLVGKSLRYHTLPVFFFVLGGVLYFGFSGLVLGPIALAVGSAVFEICKRRLNNA